MKFFSSRALLIVSLCTPVGLLSAAAAETPVCPFLPTSETPTKLDYLVLASYADAPHLLSLSAYGMRAENRGGDKPPAPVAPDTVP